MPFERGWDGFHETEAQEYQGLQGNMQSGSPAPLCWRFRVVASAVSRVAGFEPKDALVQETKRRKENDAYPCNTANGEGVGEVTQVPEACQVAQREDRPCQGLGSVEGRATLEGLPHLEVRMYKRSRQHTGPGGGKGTQEREKEVEHICRG